MEGNIAIGLKYEEVNDFSEGLAAVKLSEKWGYIDTLGEIAIRPQFLYAGIFSEGFASVIIDTIPDITSIIINKSGKQAFPHRVILAGPVVYGVAPVVAVPDDILETYGVDWNYWRIKTVEKITDYNFEIALKFSDGYGPVKLDGKWGYVDTLGRLVIEPEFVDAGHFMESLAMVQLEDRWVFINKKGEPVIGMK